MSRRQSSAANLHHPIQQFIREQNTYDQHNVVYAVGGDLGDQRALAVPISNYWQVFGQ
jgi:hypothetical protein